MREPAVQRVYVTNWGTLKLHADTIRSVEEAAELDQRGMWLVHEDDMIGVPEVEVWNGLVHAALTAECLRQYEQELMTNSQSYEEYDDDE